MNDYTKIIEGILSGGHDRDQALQQLVHDEAIQQLITEFMENQCAPENLFDYFHEESIILFDRGIRQKVIAITSNVKQTFNELWKTLWLEILKTENKDSDEEFDSEKVRNDVIEVIGKDKRLMGIIHSDLNNIGCNSSDKMEVYQNSIILLHRNLLGGKYKASGAMKGYFRRICFLEGLNHRRMTVGKSTFPIPSYPDHEGEPEDNIEIPEESPQTPEEILISKETVNKITRCLTQLNDENQNLLRLKMEGFSISEIANELKLEKAQVSRKLYIAKNRLIEVLKKPLSDSIKTIRYNKSK